MLRSISPCGSKVAMTSIPGVADPAYLRGAQYKDSKNLNARIELHRRFSTNPVTWSRWAFDQLLVLLDRSSDRPQRLLELGAGAGTLWAANYRRIPRHWKIVLSDFSSGMLADANRAIPAPAGTFDLLLADAHDIPFEALSFDAVIANHMLYHVANRPKALREIQRVLHPDGVLLASTIGNRHLREIDEWLRRFGVDQRYWGVAATQAFSLENGRDQLAAVFDHVEERRYEDSLRVTEVEPVIAYILSMRAGSQLPENATAQLRHELEAQIAAHGALHITKDSGLFVASAKALPPAT